MKLTNIHLIFIKEEKNCRISSFSYWLLYYYCASLQAEWTENPWLSKMIIVFVVPNKYGMRDWTTATRVVKVFFHNKTNLLQLSPRCSFACPSLRCIYFWRYFVTNTWLSNIIANEIYSPCELYCIMLNQLLCYL